MIIYLIHVILIFVAYGIFVPINIATNEFQAQKDQVKNPVSQNKPDSTDFLYNFLIILHGRN
jgi:hypothetical protein